MGKFWMHVVAGLVGFVTAGLIVFLVFGNASREGATQDGAAPESLANGAGGSLCGTIKPSEIGNPDVLAKVEDNLPTIVDQKGSQLAGLARPDQKAWLARIVAGSGFCLDEIVIGDTQVKLSISTVDSVSLADAAAFTGAALVAAHERPLNRPSAQAVTFVGEQRNTVIMSARSAGTFAQWRRANNGTTSVTDLIRFSRTARLGGANLRILGWK